MTRKIKLLSCCFLLLVQSLNAQLIESCVEGILQVYPSNDTTDLYIGTQISPQVHNNSSTSFNTIVGNFAGNRLEAAAYGHTFLGSNAGTNSRLCFDNTFLGAHAGLVNGTGFENVFVGADAGHTQANGYGNVYIGKEAGNGNLSANNSVFIGQQAGAGGVSLSNSVYIGYQAGFLPNTYNTSRSGNVFIGYQAGYGEQRSNTLIIENESTSSDNPLIYGEFDNDVFQINGDLRVDISNGTNSTLRMKGTNGNFNEVIKYSSLTNDCVMGSVSGSGGRLFLRSNGSSNFSIIENGNVGIGTIAPTEKLEVNGEALVLGDIQTNANALVSGELIIYSLPTNGSTDLRVNAFGVLSTSTSDRRLKTEIYTFQNALSKLLKLRGVSFNWKDEKDAGTQLGVIAQEVHDVIPEIVTQNGKYLGVDYSELSAVFIEAVKEQQKIIEQQQLEIEKRKTKIDLLTTKVDRWSAKD